jgi:hypothetical protein
MRRIVAALFSTCLMFSSAWAATVDQDVKRYLDLLAVDKNGAGLEPLAWEGLSDPRLFDQIEERLLAVSVGKPKGKTEVEKFAHYVRALGFSGQPKYIQTLQMLTSHSYYDGYAERALVDQPLYQRWNPTISNRASFNPRLSDDVNRFMNMLASDDLLLNRLASKRIYEGTRDSALYDALEKKIRANYMRDLSGDLEDSIAWMVKALGSSKTEKYKPLLIEVALKSPMNAVVRHAKRSLERDYRLTNKDYIP